MLGKKLSSITQRELESYQWHRGYCKAEQLRSAEFAPCRGNWYLEDIQAYVEIGSDLIYIQDLTNALRRGLECTVYQLSERRNHWLGEYPDEVRPNDSPVDLLNWLAEQQIPTITVLYQMMKEPIEIEGAAYLTYTDRSYSTYSPFAVIKPIQTPQKWGRANVRRAILSGQIYRGKVNYSYTDDDIMDARCNCRKGDELSAQELIAKTEQLLKYDYGIRATQNEDGTAEISIYDSASSYTLYFDPQRHR